MSKVRDANDILREEGPDALRRALDLGRRPANGAAREQPAVKLAWSQPQVRDEDGAAAFKAAIESLAQLSAIEYERRRESEAARLGARVSILDAEVSKRRNSEHNEVAEFLKPPELWPDP